MICIHAQDWTLVFFLGFASITTPLPIAGLSRRKIMEISWRVTGLSKKEELYVAHVVAVLASAAARILESKQSMCIRFLPALEKNHLEFLYYVGLREDKVHDGLGRGVFECPIGWKTEEIVQLITYRLKTALVAIPNLGSVSDTQGRSRINTAHYITITVILPITNPES